MMLKKSIEKLEPVKQSWLKKANKKEKELFNWCFSKII